MSYREELLSLGIKPEQITVCGVPPIIWFQVGIPSIEQGWKLHVSCRSNNIIKLFKKILPTLRNLSIAFKVVSSEIAAQKINSGYAGAEQIGKIVTIYPSNDNNAIKIGIILTEVLKGFEGPVIDNEIRLTEDAPVYARYGSFVENLQRTNIGLKIPMIKSSNGNLLQDNRLEIMHNILGIKNPFPNSCEPKSLFGSVISDRFFVVGPISKTSSSTIWIGVDLKTGARCILKSAKRHTALDRLDVDSVDRLRNEWRLLTYLNETGIVPKVFDYTENPDEALLVMEYIEGKNILSYIHSQMSPLSNGALSDLFIKILLSVNEIHSLGVIAGNLSPTNIIIEKNEQIKLIDFGLSFKTDSAHPPLEFGTTGYTSPDVMSGSSPKLVDDFYSLAAIMYFVITKIDLSRLPNYDIILRSGNLLESPWKEIVSSLINSACTDCTGVVKDIIKELRPISKDPIVPNINLERVIQKLDMTKADKGNTIESETIIGKLGRSVALMADVGHDNTGTWRSRHPTMNNAKYRDLYMGDAGIALGLLRLGLSIENVDLIGVAVQAAENLSQTNSNDDFWGLFVGEAGVGFLYLSLWEILKEPLWLERAKALSYGISRRKYESPDLIHGAAGRGLYHLWVYEYTSSSDDIEAALSAAAYLRSTCQWTRYGPLWKSPIEISKRPLYGFAHGSAGVGYFLAEITRVMEVSWIQQLLEEIGRSLRLAKKWNESLNIYDWPASPDGDFRGGIWCHGSSGIALAFLKIYQALSDKAYLEASLEAADSALQQAHLNGPTQCHGLAGLIEVYLELFAETHDKNLLQIAKTLGQRLITVFLSETELGLMVCSELSNVFTSELMIGSTGAAAAIARLYNPDRFRYFLNCPKIAFQSHKLV